MSIAKELGYKRYFNVQGLLFRLIRVDLTKKYVKHPFLLVAPSFSFATMMFLVSWQNRRDPDLVTESLAVACDIALNFFKSLIFVLNQKKFLELIHTIWSMSKTDNVEEHDMIRGVNSRAYYLSNAIVISGFCAFFSGCILPYVITAIIYLSTSPEHFSAATSQVFTDDYSAPWIYVLVHGNTIIPSFIGAASNLAIDSLYIWLVYNLVAQFRILNMRVKRTSALLSDYEINRGITECIRFHQQIIDFAENLDASYRQMNFVQFAMGCLPFTFLGFQLTMGTGNKGFFVVWLVCKFLQIALYCVLGQQIQDESCGVAENIYDSFHWEKLSKTSRQLLIITMTRAQKCCNLTGIFFVININLFVSVYRTTHSYITILWTIAANAKE